MSIETTLDPFGNYHINIIIPGQLLEELRLSTDERYTMQQCDDSKEMRVKLAAVSRLLARLLEPPR